MKIVRINVYLVQLGRLHPVLAEIVTDEGLSGVGEAAIAYGHGGTAAAGMIKDLAETIVLGRDPMRIEELWSDLYDHSFWAKGGGAITFAGISAIETALWDIKGKALGVPVYELLGGTFRDQVRVYANGWSFQCATPADYARAGEKTVGDGFDALKCYPLAVPRPGGGIQHVTRRQVDREAADFAYEAVKALRAAVGPKIAIMLDLSGGLTTDETIRLCRRWTDLDILFVEEPADPFDVGALAEITRAIEIPVAVGERLYTRQGFRPVFERRAAHIVQPDIGNTGGIMEAKKIAAMAEAYNMRVQPHICASPVSTAAALQLDACIANFMIQELYPYRSDEHFAILDDAPELHRKGSMLPIPTRPGLGVNLVADRIRPYLWAQCTL
ncbi:MAG: mandelate racemase/muconate lactonizing enzyme family protein [Proteobacteria bacterium]|nr:mandelate racemase/muconate lactonizing enzyme family protein [Pseudomonadota bacterium]